MFLFTEFYCSRRNKRIRNSDQHRLPRRPGPLTFSLLVLWPQKMTEKGESQNGVGQTGNFFLRSGSRPGWSAALPATPPFSCQFSFPSGNFAMFFWFQSTAVSGGGMDRVGVGWLLASLAVGL